MVTRAPAELGDQRLPGLEPSREGGGASGWAAARDGGATMHRGEPLGDPVLEGLGRPGRALGGGVPRLPRSLSLSLGPSQLIPVGLGFLTWEMGVTITTSPEGLSRVL